MIVSSKVTWGLAWTGLALILAVPSADFVTGQLAPRGAAVVTSTTDPVTAGPTKSGAAPAVTTTVTKTGVIITPAGTTPPGAGDPVDTYLKNNKALPTYLTDGAQPATGDSAPAQVANIAPPSAAPVPFPSRPADPVARPIATQSAPPAANLSPPPSADPVVTGAASSAPVVIVDEPTAQPKIATTKPVPPANIVDDSASWRAPGLAQYLEREGLLSDSGDDTATTAAAPEDSYDPNGFFLSDGPNDSRAQRRARVLQMFGDDPNGPVPPASFNLF